MTTFAEIKKLSNLSHGDVAYIYLQQSPMIDNAKTMLMVQNFVTDNCRIIRFRFDGTAIVLNDEQARDIIRNGKVPALEIHRDSDGFYAFFSRVAL